MIAAPSECDRQTDRAGKAKKRPSGNQGWVFSAEFFVKAACSPRPSITEQQISGWWAEGGGWSKGLCCSFPCLCLTGELLRVLRQSKGFKIGKQTASRHELKADEVSSDISRGRELLA